MSAKSVALCCLLSCLFLETSVLGQSQDEIDKLKDQITNSIKNPMLESKPSDEELKKAKEEFENNRKARPNLLQLLRVKKVLAELDLTGDQKVKIKELRSKKRKDDVAPPNLSMVDDDIDSEIKKVVDFMIVERKRFNETEQARKAIDSATLKVLLPHQLQRLEQIATQIHIERAGAGAAMLHPSCVDFLKISAEQKELISNNSVENSEKLVTRLAELREKAQEDLLAEFTPRQRKLFAELKGDEFDLGIEYTTSDLRKRWRHQQGRPDAFSLLAQTRIKQEVDLLSDQIKEIRKIQKEFFTKQQSLYQENFSPEKLKALQQESKSHLEEILLPHQSERLQQIATQIHIHREGEAAALTHPETAELLKLTDKQKSGIKDRSKEIARNLKRDVKKSKEKLDKQVVALLDASQRKLFKDLVGEKFAL